MVFTEFFGNVACYVVFVHVNESSDYRIPVCIYGGIIPGPDCGHPLVFDLEENRERD